MPHISGDRHACRLFQSDIVRGEFAAGLGCFEWKLICGLPANGTLAITALKLSILAKTPTISTY